MKTHGSNSHGHVTTEPNTHDVTLAVDADPKCVQASSSDVRARAADPRSPRQTSPRFRMGLGNPSIESARVGSDTDNYVGRNECRAMRKTGATTSNSAKGVRDAEVVG